MKTSIVNSDIWDILRKTEDGILYTIADLDEMFSERIADLMNLYKSRMDSKKFAPDPGDFMVGFTLYILAMCEETHEILRGPSPTAKDDFKDILKSILDLGPRTSIGAVLAQNKAVYEKLLGEKG